MFGTKIFGDVSKRGGLKIAVTRKVKLSNEGPG